MPAGRRTLGGEAALMMGLLKRHATSLLGQPARQGDMAFFALLGPPSGWRDPCPRWLGGTRPWLSDGQWRLPCGL